MGLLDRLLGAMGEDAAVRDVRLGPYCTAVWSRSCGLAATVAECRCEEEPPLAPRGNLIGRSALELAQLVRSPVALERSLGVAALNSLIVEEQDWEAINAFDLIARGGRESRVALVGHFPFASHLKLQVGTLWVLERDPQPGDLPAVAAPEIIPIADTVAITGSALVYGGMEELLALCSPRSSVIVLGPSTPLTRVWFAEGVSAVCGSRVSDPSRVMEMVGQGATFRQMRGNVMHSVSLSRGRDTLLTLDSPRQGVLLTLDSPRQGVLLTLDSPRQGVLPNSIGGE